MKQLDPKDKHLIAQMAANIVAPIVVPMMMEQRTKRKMDDDVLSSAAQMAVSQAIEILDAIEMRMPCGKCDECNNGNRCREIPGDE